MKINSIIKKLENDAKELLSKNINEKNVKLKYFTKGMAHGLYTAALLLQNHRDLEVIEQRNRIEALKW